MAESATKPSLWHRLVNRLRSWFEIPYGYQDENGFHYGVEPVPAGQAAQTNAVRRVFTDRATHVIPTPCPVSLAHAEAVEDHH